MEDPPQAGTSPILVQNVQAIRHGFPAMDNYGLFLRASLAQLMAKNRCLYVPSRMIVVIVKADFAPGD
jgi:hypothetical protein